MEVTRTLPRSPRICPSRDHGSFRTDHLKASGYPSLHAPPKQPARPVPIAPRRRVPPHRRRPSITGQRRRIQRDPLPPLRLHRRQRVARILQPDGHHDRPLRMEGLRCRLHVSAGHVHPTRRLSRRRQDPRARPARPVLRKPPQRRRTTRARQSLRPAHGRGRLRRLGALARRSRRVRCHPRQAPPLSPSGSPDLWAASAELGGTPSAANFPDAIAPQPTTTESLLVLASSWRFNESGTNLGPGWATSAHPVDGTAWRSGPRIHAFESSLVAPIGKNLRFPNLNNPFVVTYYFESELAELPKLAHEF